MLQYVNSKHCETEILHICKQNTAWSNGIMLGSLIYIKPIYPTCTGICTQKIVSDRCTHFWHIWLCFYQTRSAWSMDQGSIRKRSAVHNFATTVTKFCVMWEGLSLPLDTKFGNCRGEIVDRRMIFIWSLIHGSGWSGLIKVEPSDTFDVLPPCNTFRHLHDIQICQSVQNSCLWINEIRRNKMERIENTCNTETEILSFWRQFHHWLYRKLSKWQLSLQAVTKISLKCWNFRFCECSIIFAQQTRVLTTACLYGTLTWNITVRDFIIPERWHGEGHSHKTYTLWKSIQQTHVLTQLSNIL